MATATAGFAVVLQRSISSVFTTIAQLRDMTGPTISRSTSDVTNKDSTDRWREFITGLVDAGEVTFNIVFNPDATTHATLIADLVSQTAQAWKILTDTDDTATFSGFVTGFTLTAPLDGEHSADLTIKITGAVTFS